MKAAIELNATPRETLGKGGSRALRREARVPVVVYANGKSTLSLSIDGNSVANEYFKGGFMSKIVALKVDGKDVFAIPRDVQLNPVSDKIEHVDFLHVDDKSVIKVTVPVHFLNTDKSVGIKRGGVLNIVAHTVELLCPVNSIPKALEIDIAELNIGDSVHIHNVALPTGVKPGSKRDLTIASLTGRQKEEAEVATSAVSAGAVPAAKVAEQAAGAKPAAGAKAAPAKPAAKK